MWELIFSIWRARGSDARSVLRLMLSCRAAWQMIREDDWRHFWSLLEDQKDPLTLFFLSTGQKFLVQSLIKKLLRRRQPQRPDDTTREEVNWLISRGVVSPEILILEGIQFSDASVLDDLLRDWVDKTTHSVDLSKHLQLRCDMKQFKKLQPAHVSYLPLTETAWHQIFNQTENVPVLEKVTKDHHPKFNGNAFVGHPSFMATACRHLWRGHLEIFRQAMAKTDDQIPFTTSNLIGFLLERHPQRFVMQVENFSWHFVTSCLENPSVGSQMPVDQSVRQVMDSLICREIFLHGILNKWAGHTDGTNFNRLPLPSPGQRPQRWALRDLRLIHFWQRHLEPHFQLNRSSFLTRLWKHLNYIRATQEMEFQCPRFMEMIFWNSPPDLVSQGVKMQPKFPGLNFHDPNSHLSLLNSRPKDVSVWSLAIDFCLWYLDHSSNGDGIIDPPTRTLLRTLIDVVRDTPPKVEMGHRGYFTDRLLGVRDLMFSLLACPDPWVDQEIISCLSPDHLLELQENHHTRELTWQIHATEWYVSRDCSICRWFERQHDPQRVITGITCLSQRKMGHCEAFALRYILNPLRYPFFSAPPKNPEERLRRFEMIFHGVTKLTPPGWGMSELDRVWLIERLIRQPGRSNVSLQFFPLVWQLGLLRNLPSETHRELCQVAEANPLFTDLIRFIDRKRDF